MNDALQCTAVTPLPLDDVLPFLHHAPDEPDPAPYVLCELGEHRPHTEHAAYLGPGPTPEDPAPWFFWHHSGHRRTHRIAPTPWCPGTLRHLATGIVQRCAFFDHHTAAHSWNVTDPLGELIAAQLITDDPTGRTHP